MNVNDLSYGFSDDVREAIAVLFDSCIAEQVRKTDNGIAIADCSYGSFRRNLVFEDIDGLSDFEDKALFFKEETFEETDAGYRIEGSIVDYITDDTVPFTMNFKGARVEYDVFNAVNRWFSAEGPWDYLGEVAFEIYQKSLQRAQLLNEKERELLPLIAELRELYTGVFGQTEGDYSFEVLRKRIQDYGYTELFKTIDSIMENAQNERKRILKIHTFKSELNQQKYEPLWQHIYEEIALSQKEYPSLGEAVYPDLVSEARQKIEKQLKEHGYAGEYPDFYKAESIDKIHLAESYEMSYFVCHERNVVFRVHCFEGDCFGGNLEIQLMSATELLKKNDEPKSIYSCFFNAKGRCFFRETYVSFEYSEEKGEIVSEDTAVMVGVAVKRAELRKLTKEERKVAGDYISYKFLLVSALAMGLFFGFFMTVGFMLIAVILALVFGLPGEIPALMADGPWLLIFCTSGGSFGVIMGIITLLCKQK